MIYKVSDLKRRKRRIKIILFSTLPCVIIGSVFFINYLQMKALEERFVPSKAYVNNEFDNTITKESEFKNEFTNNRFDNLDSSLVFEDPKTGVILPIYYAPDDDKAMQKAALAKGLMIQQSYSDLEGNFVIAGHHDYYGGYLTSEIDTLQKGDRVFVYQKKGSNKYTKYTYEIIKREVLSKYDTTKVYTKQKDTLHIITCKEWYKTNERIVWTGKKIKKEEIDMT